MKRRRFLGLVTGLFASLVGKVPKLPTLPRKDTYRGDIERALLGSLMMDSRQVPVVATVIHVGHFSTYQRSLVFEVISSHSRHGMEVSLQAVENDLAEVGLLEYVGGHEALVEMVENTPNPENAPFYAESLVERFNSDRATGKVQFRLTPMRG